jgi:DNA-binding MarR family transcriptional regulator
MTAEDLAKHIDKPVDDVRRAIKALEAKGLIRRASPAVDP